MQTPISQPQAVDIWQKYLHNSCTQEELEALFAYMQTQPAFAEEMEQQAASEEALWQTWQQPDAADAPQPQWEGVYTHIVKATQPAPVKRMFWRYSAAAAALVVMVLGGRWVWLQNSTKVHAPLAIAPAVVTKPLIKDASYLPDSTRVMLKDSSTTLFMRFTPNGRVVTLKGDAWFDVKPMADAPFVVIAGDVTIRALGTAFLVSQLPNNQVEVKVTSGKVQVLSNHKIVGVLNAAEALTISSTQQVTMERQIDTTAVMASLQETEWRWNNSSLEEVITWLNQHYQVNITLQGTLLQHTLFTASFTNPVTLDDILLVLQKLYNIKVAQTGTHNYILTY